MTRYFVEVITDPVEYSKRVAEIQNGGYQISMINFTPPMTWTVTYFHGSPLKNEPAPKVQ